MVNLCRYLATANVEYHPESSKIIINIQNRDYTVFLGHRDYVIIP